MLNLADLICLEIAFAICCEHETHMTREDFAQSMINHEITDFVFCAESELESKAHNHYN